MQKLIKILAVILLSSVKFVAGPPFAYYNDSYEFHFFESIFYCVLGGMLGVFVFVNFSKPIFKLWERIRQLFKNKNTTPFFDEPTIDLEGQVKIQYKDGGYMVKHKRIFTPRNRRIVKLWTKYGLAGIALLTPVLISIPIGSILAARYVHNKKKIYLYMFCAILFWSLAMTGVFELLQISHPQEIKKVFE
ncbi:MAG: hypothetical protein IPO27_11700 [Bacteroidetes bacterium]|nr:hypothetical protein [Bacteroidota bacterium]